MVEITNAGQKGKIYIIVVGILVLLIAVIIFVFGAGSIMKILMFLVEAILLIGTLFLIAYFFYYLFIKKHSFDVNYVNKKKLIDAGTRIKRPLLKDLYLSGDKGHTRAKVGTIKGYLRMQVLTRNYIYTDKVDEKTGRTVKELLTIPNERGEDIPQFELDKAEQDVFIVGKGGLLGLFQDPMVIRVNPEDHNELVGDVDLYGFSIIPISEYWFLNNDMLDTRKIDYAILREAHRTVSFTVLSDTRDLIEISSGLDSRHSKFVASKSLVEIPETRNVNQEPSPRY
jgi:hypothetical protein